MYLSLHRITGNVYKKKFDPNEKVHNICEFLSQQLNSSPNSIFIINLNKKPSFFYTNNQTIQNIISNKNKHFIFTMINPINSSFYSKSSKLKKSYNHLKRKSTYFKSKGFINAINNFKEIKKINCSTILDYSKYAKILRNVPKDYEKRITQIVQMGYDKNDCKIALREVNYNVKKAIDILCNNNDSNSSINNNGFDSSISTNTFERSNNSKSNDNFRLSSLHDDFSSFTFDSFILSSTHDDFNSFTDDDFSFSSFHDDSFTSVDEQNNTKEIKKINKKTNTKPSKQSKSLKEMQTIEISFEASFTSSEDDFIEPSKTTNDFENFGNTKKTSNIKKKRLKNKNKNNEMKNNESQTDNINPIIPKPTKFKTNSDENPKNFDPKMITDKIKNDIDSPEETISKNYKKITNHHNHQLLQNEENIKICHKHKNHNCKPSSSSSIQPHHHLPPPPPPPPVMFSFPPPPPNQRLSSNVNEDFSDNEYNFYPTFIQDPLENPDPFYNCPMQNYPLIENAHLHRSENSIEHHFKQKNSSPPELAEEHPNFKMTKFKQNNINQSANFIEKPELIRQRNFSVQKNQFPPLPQHDKQQLHYSNHHNHHQKRSMSILNHSKPSILTQQTLMKAKSTNQDTNPPNTDIKTIIPTNYALSDKPPKLISPTPRPKNYI